MYYKIDLILLLLFIGKYIPTPSEMEIRNYLFDLPDNIKDHIYGFEGNPTRILKRKWINIITTNKIWDYVSINKEKIYSNFDTNDIIRFLYIIIHYIGVDKHITNCCQCDIDKIYITQGWYKKTPLHTHIFKITFKNTSGTIDYKINVNDTKQIYDRIYPNFTLT